MNNGITTTENDLTLDTTSYTVTIHIDSLKIHSSVYEYRCPRCHNVILRTYKALRLVCDHCGAEFFPDEIADLEPVIPDVYRIDKTEFTTSTQSDTWTQPDNYTIEYKPTTFDGTTIGTVSFSTPNITFKWKEDSHE